MFEHRIHHGIRRYRARVVDGGDVGSKKGGDIVEGVRELSRHLRRGFAATARRPSIAARRAEIHRATQRLGLLASEHDSKSGSEPL